MSDLESDTIGGYNSVLTEHKAANVDCLITTVLFDHDYNLLHDRIDIRAIDLLTNNDYQVRGSTALLDAVGQTINKISNVQQHTAEDFRAEKVLFVIVTDGEENSSSRFTADQIKSMIEWQKSRYGWEFIFLGANIDAVATAAQFGISRNRAQSYHADHRGTKHLYESLCCLSKSYCKKMKISDDWSDKIEEDYLRRSPNHDTTDASLNDLNEDVQDGDN
jgi:hypothetical protein